MTNIITAAEARARTIDPALRAPVVLDRLDKLIRDAAARGETRLRVPGDLTVTSGYSIKFRTPGVGEALAAAGYIITPRIDNLEHMDVWLEISWRTA